MVIAGPPRRRATLRWVLVGVIVVILALPALLAGTAALFPGPVLRIGLRAAGYDVAFDDLRLGLAGLELSGLRIGTPPDHRLERLRIGYQPRRLLHGRLDLVEVEGLVLGGRLDHRGLHLTGLDGAGAGDGPVELPLPWPERIAADRIRLELATPGAI